MNNPNQELLDFAVKNIKEWNDEFTHLRSDASTYPLFWTSGGSWKLWLQHDAAETWQCYGESYECVKDFSFTSKTLQVITKQEWEQAMLKGTRIERDKEYDLKVSGEQLALIWLFSGATNGGFSISSLYYAIDELFVDVDRDTLIGVIPTIPSNTSKSEINKWLNSIFTVPETEKERNLRELSEQYKVLGEKIEAIKNSTNGEK